MLKNYKNLKVWQKLLEKQILLAGDLDFIEKGKRGILKKDIAEIERMLRVLITSLEKKILNP